VIAPDGTGTLLGLTEIGQIHEIWSGAGVTFERWIGDEVLLLSADSSAGTTYSYLDLGRKEVALEPLPFPAGTRIDDCDTAGCIALVNDFLDGRPSLVRQSLQTPSTSTFILENIPDDLSVSRIDLARGWILLEREVADGGELLRLDLGAPLASAKLIFEWQKTYRSERFFAPDGSGFVERQFVDADVFTFWVPLSNEAGKSAVPLHFPANLIEFQPWP
jgi:hypothetical protein